MAKDTVIFEKSTDKMLALATSGSAGVNLPLTTTETAALYMEDATATEVITILPGGDEYWGSRKPGNG